jgi:hypothetical protein
MNLTAILIGLAGGFASALLFAAVLGGGALGTPLFALSPLPIAIAALGWGTAAGALAAVTGAALIASVMAPAAGLVYAIATAAPIAWYAHLAGLARQGEDGELEWYPLWRVFSAITVLTPITTVACGALMGVSVDDVASTLADALLAVGASQEAGVTPDRAELVENLRFYVRLMPVTVTMLWLSVMVANLWLAARIVRKSDRLRRPWEPMPEAAGLPAFFGLVLLVALALSFGDSALALAAGAFSGAFAMAFAILGFATLHVITRGNPARGLLLGTLYAATFVFSLPLLPLALLGIADSITGVRRRRLSHP